MSKQRTLSKKTKIFLCLGICLGALLLLFGIAEAYMRFGGFGTGACADTAEFAKYAQPIEAFAVPDGARVVALGEATHGNREFQALKLTVFRRLVETAGVRALALEADFGCAETANRYIHGGGGTARDAAAALGFAIYRTEEMAKLLVYMRAYNAEAPAGGDLVLYGMDMQRVADSFRYLREAAEACGADTADFAALWDSEADNFDAAYSADARRETITALRAAMLARGMAADAPEVHFADVLLQNLEYGAHFGDADGGNAMRDRMMAENVLWALRVEEGRAGGRLFVTGHNGHIERTAGGAGARMGNLLAEALGDGYFAVGTDFYKSLCNLPRADGTRLTHTFYSHDPLAKAAKACGKDICYLDFAAVPATSPLAATLAETVPNGSLGEMYDAFFMRLFPASYRVMRVPAQNYDAMIFVADAHPTVILPAEN